MKYIFTALLLYIGIIVGSDIVEYIYDIPVWDQTWRTSNCYNWFEQYLEKDYDRNKDYSEGIFENNWNMSLQNATINKYQYIFDKLELKKGMKLLDAGCGTGVWMDFLKTRGVETVGLTLSNDQAKLVRDKGLIVHVMDYRKLNKDFIGQFDRITALGSSEHVCLSRGSLNKNVAAKRCNQTRLNVWKLFNNYLKPDGKVYITMLTINNNYEWSIWDYLQAYILERHYGGYYSNWNDIENVIDYTGFYIGDVQDKTKDYHWSSIADKDHFGHWYIKWHEYTFNKISYIFKNITDPFLLHHWAYYYLDSWMWQFGGYQTTPLNFEQVTNSPMHLKYFMLKKLT